MANVISFLRFSQREKIIIDFYVTLYNLSYQFIWFYGSILNARCFFILEKFEGLRKEHPFSNDSLKYMPLILKYYSSKSFEKKHSFKILCVYLEWWTRLNVLRGSIVMDQVLAKKCLLFTVAPGILLTMSLERFHNWPNAKKETLPFRILSFLFLLPSSPSLSLSLSVCSNRINLLSLFIVVSSFSHPVSQVTTTFETSLRSNATELVFSRKKLSKKLIRINLKNLKNENISREINKKDMSCG